MKKIGKKLSYFTKVFLVLGLLFSNLSSLKVVFAYEGENETTGYEETLEDNVENALDEQLVNENTTSEEENVSDVSNGETEDKETELVEDETTDENTDLEVTNEGNTTQDVVGEETVVDNTSGDGNEDETASNQDETTSEGGEQVVTDDTQEDSATVTHDYTKELNDSAVSLNLEGTYLFKDSDTDKKVYVIEGVNDTEINDIVSNASEDYSVEIVENEIVLKDGDNTVTYQVVVYNDELLNDLIKAIVNDEELEDGDVNNDKTIDKYDAVLLKQILKYGFGNDVVNQAITIDSKFDGDASNISVGDSFTVQYVLTLSEYAVDGITGLVNYNKDMLSLDKLEVRNFETGDNNDGKFLYFGDYLRGTEVVTKDEDGNELVSYSPTDYVVVIMTFTALEAGNDTISVDDIGYFYEGIYYEGNSSPSIDVSVVSSNNSLSSLSVAGNEITLNDETTEYSLTVANDVTTVDLEYVLASDSAHVYSIAAPEELAVGENVITIVVEAENGDKKTYTITVTREEATNTQEETTENVVSPVNYQEDTNNYVDDSDDKKEEINVDKTEDDDKKTEDKEETKDESKLSRIIIIILILLAIAGLIYLIFKDDDDEETKKANKEVDKLRKEQIREVNSKKVDNNKKTNKKGR